MGPLWYMLYRWVCIRVQILGPYELRAFGLDCRILTSTLAPLIDGGSSWCFPRVYYMGSPQKKEDILGVSVRGIVTVVSRSHCVCVLGQGYAGIVSQASLV